VLAYIESSKGLRRGEAVWQLSFGSGFKCNSAVWRARRTFKVRPAALARCLALCCAPCLAGPRAPLRACVAAARGRLACL
jgi:hypothetical protein